MIRKMLLAAAGAALVTVLTPAAADAYGAAHVGYTHVGPNGVYHAGATEVRTPYGAAGGARTSAYGAGGGTYHAGYAAGTGGAAGGYRYGTTAGGAAYAGGVYRRY